VECLEGRQTRTFGTHPPKLNVTRDCWKRKVTYFCGLGSDKHECEVLKEDGCTQVKSECNHKKGRYCLEFKQTYRCPTGDYELFTGLEGRDGVMRFAPQGGESIDEYFESSEFARAAAHAAIVDEIAKPGADGLEPAIVSELEPDNPQVFPGTYRDCKIVLPVAGNDLVQNCCDFKGIVAPFGCNAENHVKLKSGILGHRCTKVADKYCSLKTPKPFEVCLEKRDAYCCYGSRLAKVIHSIVKLDNSQTSLIKHQRESGYMRGLGIINEDEQRHNCRRIRASEIAELDFDTPNARAFMKEIVDEYKRKAQEKHRQIQEEVARHDLNDNAQVLEQKMSHKFKRPKLDNSARAERMKEKFNQKRSK